MKAKIKIGKVELEGTCFNCGKQAALNILGTNLLCASCYKLKSNPDSGVR